VFTGGDALRDALRGLAPILCSLTTNDDLGKEDVDEYVGTSAIAITSNEDGGDGDDDGADDDGDDDDLGKQGEKDQRRAVIVNYWSTRTRREIIDEIERMGIDVDTSSSSDTASLLNRLVDEITVLVSKYASTTSDTTNGAQEEPGAAIASGSVELMQSLEQGIESRAERKNNDAKMKDMLQHGPGRDVGFYPSRSAWFDDKDAEDDMDFYWHAKITKMDDDDDDDELWLWSDV